MSMIRSIFAVFLLLTLLCSCAAPREVTTISLPGSAAASAPGTSPDILPGASPDSASPNAALSGPSETSHLEYQTVSLPAPLLSVTALTVLEDAVILGGFTENGLSLSQMTLDGEAASLPLPDGTEYLYALCPDGAGGVWLLSGSLPAAYTDGLGVVHFPDGQPEGKLALTRYDDAFSIQESVLLPTAYSDGPRFFQLCATTNGFLLLSASLLVSLDKTGAEIARQALDADDGWRYQAMALSGGVLCVLARDHYGAQPLPELRRFAPITLDAMDPIPCTDNVTGLGLAEDGRLLLGSRERIDLCPENLTTAEALVVWRELGIAKTAEQILSAASGYVLFSRGDTELALLRRVPGPAPEKSVLTLAIATEDPYFDSLTAMIEAFNRSQDRYLVDYTAYAGNNALSNASDLAPADQLRTAILAGQAPDLYAFYTAGYNAPPFTAKAVGTDLLPLLGSNLTEDSLVPNLYSLLTEDGCLYELPLSIEIDTLIGPASLFPKSGVTLSDLEQARSNMPDDMVPLDSWNTPENLLALCAPYCIGAFCDLDAGTCSFETQSFYDYLAWCKGWGGDGSTPDTPERTLVKLTWTNSVAQLTGRSESAEEYWFGEPDYTYIGFPTNGESSGSGYRVLTSLAVSPQCSNLPGVKAFLAFCFSYPQESALPANYDLLQSEMQAYLNGERRDWRGEVQQLSQTDADRFSALLDSITVLEGLEPALEDILCEEANVYFAGGCTAEEAAASIQSRASLYLAEQCAS